VGLLFVHGAWHGAWCWAEHFLDDFAERGYRVAAVSLRGHGASSLRRFLHTCSIADYVDDLRAIAETLPLPPVVIGHSMGGLVVQKYLQKYPAAAGVLLASIPPHGIAAPMLRFARRHPWQMAKIILTANTLLTCGTVDLARAMLFSESTPAADVVKYRQRLQPESLRALLVDMLFRDLPKPAAVRTPLLVLGAESDGWISPREVRATARAYHTTAAFFPGGHDMMLEPERAHVVDCIHRWLDTALTAPETPPDR
jgi:pimeloyl-ACP methyl ester carboxylesterase